MNFRLNKSVILLSFKKNLNDMKSVAVKFMLIVVFSFAASVAIGNDSTKVKHRNADEVTLKLPAGFSAVSIAENVGKNRHIAVNTNGDCM